MCERILYDAETRYQILGWNPDQISFDQLMRLKDTFCGFYFHKGHIHRGIDCDVSHSPWWWDSKCDVKDTFRSVCSYMNCQNYKSSVNDFMTGFTEKSKTWCAHCPVGPTGSNVSAVLCLKCIAVMRKQGSKGFLPRIIPRK